MNEYTLFSVQGYHLVTNIARKSQTLISLLVIFETDDVRPSSKGPANTEISNSLFTIYVSLRLCRLQTGSEIGLRLQSHDFCRIENFQSFASGQENCNFLISTFIFSMFNLIIIWL